MRWHITIEASRRHRSKNHKNTRAQKSPKSRAQLLRAQNSKFYIMGFFGNYIWNFFGNYMLGHFLETICW